MKVKIIPLIIIATILCCCTKKVSIVENEIDNEYQHISILPEKFEPYDITSLLDTVKYVKLQLTDESIIGSVDKVIIYEDRIYVLDIQISSLFVFDMDGNYLTKIAHVGQGPEEYIQLDFFDFDYEHRQIVLTDLMSYWVMRYDLEGNFIDRQKIPIWAEGVIPCFDKGYMLYSNFRNNQENLEQEYNLLYLDSLMNIKYAYFPYNSSNFEGTDVRLPQNGSFYSTENGLYFFFPYGNLVYQIAPERLVGRYQFDFGEFTLDSSFLKKPKKLKEYIGKHEFNSLRDFKANDNLLFFTMETNIIPGAIYNVYFSKQSGNAIGSFMFVLGDPKHYFHGWFKTGYGSWIVSELQIKDLLDWRDSFHDKNVFSENKFVKEKKALADELTLDDNSVLMFYKLKFF